MNYPLTFSFKLVALAPQIQVTDATGQSICYVRQKLLKLKESVEVFTDKSRAEKLCEIRADRVIDFSATYRFFDPKEGVFGSVQRQGMRSLWRAHYIITDGTNPLMEVNEESAFVKVMDGIFGEIPILGGFSGYLFHPTYLITNSGTGDPILRIRKQPAFWEGKFTMEKIAEQEPADELRAVMATLMMLLLERRRG